MYPLSARVPLVNSRPIRKQRGIYWLYWQFNTNEGTYSN
jgi:hypothetical protein